MRRCLMRLPTNRCHPSIQSEIGKRHSSLFGFSNDLSSTNNDDPKSNPASEESKVYPVSAFDESRNWRDWFHPAEYENPWDKSSSRFQYPLDNGPADSATRHLIHLLQNFHRFEHTTTAQCNTVIANLLELSIGQPSISERAYAILENMEHLEATHRTLRHQSNQRGVAEKVARPLPKPNRTTYNTVLRIFAKTITNKEKGPDLAKRVVETMHERYEHHQELELRPNAFHWNCVLLAYLECDDPQRPIYGLKLMLEEKAELDVSSYVHLLRMCNSTENIGANVAVRMWQEILEKRNDIPDLPSVFYSHFLQAIRSLPVGRLRSLYFDECFSRARKLGKVNRFVLKEFFLHNQSSELFKKHLGNYQRQIYGMKAEDALRRLVTLIPTEWTQHAN